MEGQSKIRRSSGIYDVRSIFTADKDADPQNIDIIDGDGFVILRKSSPWPASLTPAQALWLAKLLTESAGRIDAASSAAPDA